MIEYNVTDANYSLSNNFYDLSNEDLEMIIGIWSRNTRRIAV